MLISVDAGKDTTKSCMKKEGVFLTKQFKSRVYNVTEDGDTLAHGNTFRVLFEGQEYLVGEGGSEQNYSTSKIDDYNRICQYVAITQFLKEGKSHEIDLMTGFPAAHYKSEKLRNEYTENIRGKDKITITVDEKNYSFKFNSINVRPEGAGITVLKPELFNEKNTLVIDIGGQNLNIVLFNDFAFDPTKMISENAGGVTVEQSLINTLSSAGIENMDSHLIRTVIKDKTVRGYTDQEFVKKLIQNTINKYIKSEIIEKLDKNNINYSQYDIVFIGGTSFILKDYLQEYFKDGIFMESMEESQFVNCKGFYKMGEL